MNKPFTKDATWETNKKALEKLPRNQITLFACDLARLTLPIWEQQHPNDKRPRSAIETTELFVYGQTTFEQLKDALDDVDVGTESINDVSYHAASVALLAANAAYYSIWTSNYASYAVEHTCLANPQIQKTVQTLYHQTTPITIPTTPILQAIAHNIIQTRNFQEYNILLDNLEEVHNIRLERSIPKGLSHFVLFHLTNTH